MTAEEPLTIRCLEVVSRDGSDDRERDRIQLSTSTRNSSLSTGVRRIFPSAQCGVNVVYAPALRMGQESTYALHSRQRCWHIYVVAAFRAGIRWLGVTLSSSTRSKSQTETGLPRSMWEVAYAKTKQQKQKQALPLAVALRLVIAFTVVVAVIELNGEISWSPRFCGFVRRGQQSSAHS